MLVHHTIIVILLVGFVFAGENDVETGTGETQSLQRWAKMFSGRFFSISCDAPEKQQYYSDWTQCWWPRGDLRVLIREFLQDAKEVGCKVPFRALLRAGMKELSKRRGQKYLRHPLYQRIPNEQCGNCARRAQCCTLARSFVTQSFRSQLCENGDAPCQSTPLNSTELELLREWYPNVEPNEDLCDFSPWIEQELDKLRDGPAYQFVQKPLCQLLGTTRPTMNCRSDGDTCKCCCFGYEFVNGECQQIEGYENTSGCDDS